MNQAASISYEPQIIHVMTSDRNICYEHALSIQRAFFCCACLMNDNFPPLFPPSFPCLL